MLIIFGRNVLVFYVCFTFLIFFFLCLWLWDYWCSKSKGNIHTFNLFSSLIYWILWKNHCSFYFDDKFSTNPQLLRALLLFIYGILKAKGWTFHGENLRGKSSLSSGSNFSWLALSVSMWMVPPMATPIWQRLVALFVLMMVILSKDSHIILGKILLTLLLKLWPWFSIY